MAGPPTDPTSTTAPDPEALMRSDNPWEWLLASFLGLDAEVETGPDQAVPAGRTAATHLSRRQRGRP